jgi:Clp amino terminal domain, pathogenicity island component
MGGHNYIGTEHILLALLELEDGTGVLAGLGVDKSTAEADITSAELQPSQPTSRSDLEAPHSGTTASVCPRTEYS